VLRVLEKLPLKNRRQVDKAMIEFEVIKELLQSPNPEYVARAPFTSFHCTGTALHRPK
jgi:hypothetical protein